MANVISRPGESAVAKAIRDADPDQLLAWLKGLRDDGLEARKGHEAQWWENIAGFRGDLWVEYDAHKNRLYELDKPDHRVRIPINLVQPAVRTEYSKLLKNRPIVNTLARSNDKADIDSSKVGNQMLDWGEAQFHMPKVRRRALQWALLCGAGGVFVDYDDSLMAKIEVHVDFDGNPVFNNEEITALQEIARDRHQAIPKMFLNQGELVIKAASPFQWIFDFSSNYVEEADWLIYTEIMDVDKVYRRWGADIVDPPRLSMTAGEARLLSKAGFEEAEGWYRGRTQKLVEIHRAFIKPGHRYFPKGAEIVFTDTELIDAKAFPFQDGELPLSVMGHIFMPVSQHPMSIVEQVKPVVLELSKTESQMIENRNLMANPPWLEYVQNRIEGEIVNKPGMRLTVNYMPNVPEPHPIQMPDLPPYVQNLPQLLGEHVLEITGQNETSQGQVPPGARSGVAIAYLTEENDTKLGPTVMEWEEMNERVAWQMLSRFAQFYDVPRTIQIYKPHSDPEVIDFVGTMLQGVAGVKVQAGSALPRSLAAKQQFTLDLYDRGLIRNPRTIMDMLDVGQGEPDEWERDMDEQEWENRQMDNGTFVEVQEWQNHQAHLYVLHGEMKSVEFKEKTPDQQRPYVQHEAMHQNFIRKQQAQQAMMQQGGPARGNGPTTAANGQNQPAPVDQYSSPDDIGAVAEAGATQSSIQ